jgi:predicted  nucleic acid-binding Zn-ribbon protein
MGSDKVSVRVDSDTSRRLDRSEVNTSGLVRSLLQHYFRTTDTVEAGLEKQLADLQDQLRALEREKSDIEQRIEDTRREIDQVEHRLKQRRENVPDEVTEFADRIRDGKFKLSNLEPDNPAVENYAQKAGIPETDVFIRKVKENL